jgi:hypothetical protein
MDVDIDFDELRGLGPRIEPPPEQDNTAKVNPFMPHIPQWQEPGWWETGAPYTDLGYLLEGGGVLSPFIGAGMASSKARLARDNLAAPEMWSHRINNIERQLEALRRGNAEDAAEAAREAEEARLRGDRNVAENRRHVTDAERAVENANAAVRAATDAESNAYAEETARRMREFDAANANIDARIARNNADVGSSALDYADDFVDNVYGQDLLPRIRTLRRDAQLGGTGTPAERTAQTAEIAESLVPEVREWIRNGRYDNLAALRHFDRPLWDEIVRTESAARAARANAGVTLERGAVPVEPYPGIGVSIEHHPDVEAFRNFRERAKAFDDAVLSHIRETPDGRLSFDRGAPLSDAALDAIAEVDPIFAEQLVGLRRRSSDMTAALEGGRPDRPAAANADNFRYDRRGDITRARRGQTRANAALETARADLARAEAAAGAPVVPERGSGDTVVLGRRPTVDSLTRDLAHANRMHETARAVAAATSRDLGAASSSVPAARLRGGAEGLGVGALLGGLGAWSQSYGKNKDLKIERDREAFDAASRQSAEEARAARAAQRATDAIGHEFGGSSVLTK